MNEEQEAKVQSRVRKILKGHGVKDSRITDFIEDIVSGSDIKLYEAMIPTEIWVDFQRWFEFGVLETAPDGFNEMSSWT
jgi:hypothetical protein